MMSKYSSLLTAAKDGDVDAMRSLLPEALDLRNSDWLSRLEKTLVAAASSGSVAACQVLLDHGVDVNEKDNRAQRAIHAACEGGHLDVCRLLLEAGASIRARNDRLFLPVECAALGGHVEVCMLLLDARKSAKARTEDRLGALVHAASRGHLELCRQLIGMRSAIEAKEGMYDVALHCAIQGGHVAVCRLLMDAGVDFHRVEEEHSEEPYLFHAARNGRATMISFLLEQGSDVHGRDDVFGKTAMHVAAASGVSDVCKAFVQAGADVNAVDFQGETPLSYAVYCDGVNTCQFLLEQGADVFFRGNLDTTLLLMAVEENVDPVPICKVLLAAGAPVNATDKLGTSPLHIAAISGDLEPCRLLVEAGADLEAVSIKFGTPLSSAMDEAKTYLESVLLQRTLEARTQQVGTGKRSLRL